MAKVVTSKLQGDIEVFRKKATKSIEKIAAERDRLRDLVQEYEETLDSVDHAVDEMDRALDTLSQYL